MSDTSGVRTPPLPVDDNGNFPDYESTKDAYLDGWMDGWGRAFAELRSLSLAERMEVFGMKAHVSASTGEPVCWVEADDA